MDTLIEEYKTTLEELDTAESSESAGERIALALAERHDWSRPAAATLVTLAQDYGTFMLRNDWHWQKHSTLRMGRGDFREKLKI